MLKVFLLFLTIGVFLYGMTLLSKGLFNLSADKLKKGLLTLTNAPWKGLLFGTVVTAILHSSSAVTVITVGLVSARMLTFRQAIGIILGANIGTTMTGEIIRFDINFYIIPIAIAGAILALMKNKKLHNAGIALLGTAAVFGAMWGLEYLASPLKDMEYINKLLLSLDNNHLYGILAGAVITGIIQSSTVCIGIIMQFLSAGAMNLDTGIAIMLGANIGTCLTAFIASLAGNRESKLTAYAHIWLNFLGVALFYPFIGTLTTLGLSLADQPDVQLAHISVIFNVICSLIVLPFARQFEQLILKIHDRK